MFNSDLNAASVDSLTHVIQVALTPVFLLSAIAALLNVFSSRLVRVADQVDQISEKLQEATDGETGHLAAQFAYLRKRSVALETAVVLGTLGATPEIGGERRQALPQGNSKGPGISDVGAAQLVRR
jgi:hypothetical protein